METPPSGTWVIPQSYPYSLPAGRHLALQHSLPASQRKALRSAGRSAVGAGPGPRDARAPARAPSPGAHSCRGARRCTLPSRGPQAPRGPGGATPPAARPRHPLPAARPRPGAPGLRGSGAPGLGLPRGWQLGAAASARTQLFTLPKVPTPSVSPST